MFDSAYNYLIDSYTLPGLLLMAVILAVLSVQLWYWAGAYARIHSFRNRRTAVEGQPPPAISVVVVIRDEYDYVSGVLPQLLDQQYGNYEVVAVDMSSEPDISDALAVMRRQYPRLHCTRMVQQAQRSRITNKMALNVGIKAAAYPNIILTTTQARPVSDKWLQLMAKGFQAGEVVIGYCGIEPAKGFANRMIRVCRLSDSIRYLSSAIRGRTYRGICHNIGYTSALYFDARGFDHLNMAAGDDDLFIQRIAARGNTSVVMNPHATMRQKVWDGAGNRFRLRLRERSTWRYYPRWARIYVSWETGSRALFFLACLAAVILMPLEIAAAAAALLVLRYGLVCFQVWRICRRLGEKGLTGAYILYDIFSPFYDFAVWTGSLFNHSRVWKQTNTL